MKSKKLTNNEKLRRLRERRNESIEKAKKKLEENKQQRYEKIKQYYEDLKQKQISKISEYYEKKKERRLKKIEKMEKQKEVNKIKKIYKQDIKKKVVKVNYKKLALAEIQLYAKLRQSKRVGDKIMVFILDKRIWVELTKYIHGGHVFGQKNYPHMAFDILNIRPITYQTNKTQFDQDAGWIKNLDQEIQEYLIKKSEDETERNILRDNNFFIEQIEKYKKLNEKEKKRLGIS